MSIKESILDFPRKTLNPKLWIQKEDGSYELREDAKSIIQTIVDWAKNTFRIPEMNVNLTGSNTSNSYSDNSDIDIHFNSPKFKIDKTDEFNTLFKKKFKEFVEQNPEVENINGIKTEIYMQPNPFQDMMSVGCYDFLNNKWLVGPEFKDIDFDPYAEYFKKDMQNVDSIIDDVRSTILKTYELSIAFVKTNDDALKNELKDELRPLVEKATKMYNALRAKRKHKSSPSSSEDAMKWRDDADWKIADSTFKLLDKFGYLGILKACAASIDAFNGDNDSIEVSLKAIISTIDEKLSVSALNDSDHEFVKSLQEVERCNESMKSMLKISAIAALMSIGSLLPQNALAKELSKARHDSIVQNQKFTKDSPLVKTAIANAAQDNEMVGPMSKTNVVNAIAMVIWKEARGKSEGDAGRKAVASVILNRAGSNPSNVVAVIKEPYAFESVAGYKGGWTDKTYQWYLPVGEISNNASNKKIWDDCNQIALDIVNQNFKSTIGNRNAFLNKATANKKVANSWGKKCTLKVGSQHFGYLPEHDPKIVVPGTMTPWKQYNKKNEAVYVDVAKGENLGVIARKNKTTIDKILSLNPSIKNPDKIRIGQKIRVK